MPHHHAVSLHLVFIVQEQDSCPVDRLFTELRCSDALLSGSFDAFLSRRRRDGTQGTEGPWSLSQHLFALAWACRNRLLLEVKTGTLELLVFPCPIVFPDDTQT